MSKVRVNASISVDGFGAESQGYSQRPLRSDGPATRNTA